MEVAAIVGMVIAVVAFVAYVTVTESKRLVRAAQRLRELEREGLTDAGLVDQLPEFEAAPMKIVLPDGREVDARHLLHKELDRLRMYGPNRSKPQDRRASRREPPAR